MSGAAGASAPMDVAAFGAHPDDLELGCGGTLAKMVRQGRRVAMVDLTRGELASRGTVADRDTESRAAAEVLGVALRRNLGLPDGNLADTPEHRRAVITILRELRPVLVMAPYPVDRHPDHGHASRLVTEACFYAGLVRLETGQEPHRPERIVYYPEHYDVEPTFVVDITQEFDTKMRAIREHRSQFTAGVEWGPETLLTEPRFLAGIEARARHYGAAIHTDFGEPFTTRVPVPSHDLWSSLALRATSGRAH